jgi:type IV pilus assembly protein PilA
MISRIRKAMEERDEGFTLIELLVVVIIIGILAAIAIPIFLSQRKGAYDSAVKSDLHSVGLAEQAYFTENGHYISNLTDSTLKDEGLAWSPASNYDASTGVPDTAVMLDDANAAVGSATTSQDGFCVEATSASGNVWSYDSEEGGLQAKGTGCP